MDLGVYPETEAGGSLLGLPPAPPSGVLPTALLLDWALAGRVDGQAPDEPRVGATLLQAMHLPEPTSYACCLPDWSELLCTTSEVRFSCQFT